MQKPNLDSKLWWNLVYLYRRNSPYDKACFLDLMLKSLCFDKILLVYVFFLIFVIKKIQVKKILVDLTQIYRFSENSKFLELQN